MEAYIWFSSECLNKKQILLENLSHMIELSTYYADFESYQNNNNNNNNSVFVNHALLLFDEVIVVFVQSPKFLCSLTISKDEYIMP